VSVTFVSTRTGWALGNAPCSHRPCTSVARTQDGGLTWRGIPGPRAETAGTDGDLQTRELRFANLRDGFAYGPDLFTTHDGGGHWSRIIVKGRVADLEVAQGRWWAVVDSCDEAEGTCPTAGKVITGAADSDRFTTAAVLAPDESGEVVLHGSRVYLALSSGSYEHADPHLRVGPSFARRTVPCNQYETPALAASADRALVLVCTSVDGAAGMQPKRAFMSTDGGLRWTRIGDPPPVVGTAVAATSPATFIANSRNGVDVTRDGGRTWTVSLSSEGASYVGFVDDSFGTALAEDKLFLTRNAGRSWSRVVF